MSARMLIVGIEAADLSLVERHVGAGRVPMIAAVRDAGRLQHLSENPAATDAAMWASFQYAAELGDHGRYHDVLRLANGRLGLAVHDEHARKTVWDQLSDAGLRVAVFDIPKCRAPRHINGIHLADWLVHGRTFPRPASYPARLADDVLARFGAAPPSRCGQTCAELNDVEILEHLEQLRRSVSMKRGAALSYLSEERWDCFLVNFKELHCCSHGYWHLIDPQHPAHDAARALRLGDPSAGILQDIDRALAELIDAAGPEAELLLFSTSGFQPNGSASHLLPQIVVQLNKRLWNYGAATLPPKSIWGVKMLPYNENACALRVAAATRAGPAGAPQSADRAAIFDALEILLKRLSDPATGEAIFEAIHRPSSECAGARAHTLPDLLLIPRAGVLPRGAVSPELGCIAGDVPRWRPGNHRQGGFALARGERVEPTIAPVESLAQLGRALLRTLLPAQ